LDPADLEDLKLNPANLADLKLNPANLAVLKVDIVRKAVTEVSKEDMVAKAAEVNLVDLADSAANKVDTAVDPMALANKYFENNLQK
jgi:hypothetical protein